MKPLTPPDDMMLPLNPTEGGGCVGLRFKADAEGNRQVTLGEFRPIEEGKPIMGDMFEGRPIPGTPYHELRPRMEHPDKKLRSAGRTLYSIPSDKFQEGWNRIFGPKPLISKTDIN